MMCLKIAGSLPLRLNYRQVSYFVSIFTSPSEITLRQRLGVQEVTAPLFWVPRVSVFFVYVYKLIQDSFEDLALYKSQKVEANEVIRRRVAGSGHLAIILVLVFLPNGVDNGR